MKERLMKHIATVALMLNFGVAGVYAQQTSVKMPFSGTSGSSAINLQQPGTNTNDEDFAGNGTLGQFTFRNVSAETIMPQASSTCSPGNVPPRLYFMRVAGAGVFRFADGSLLMVNMMQGTDCVDVTAQHGNCTMIFKIAGGTGRFQHASGILTLTETVVPVLADAINNPVYFASTGEFTGMVSGVAEEERRDEPR